MSAPVGAAAAPSINTWTDLSGFRALREQAKTDSKAALPIVAKQFESIFTQMMLKSMRDANASMGSGMGDSQAGDSYRDLFDQQLSVTLANGGNGIGIAKMLVRQLGGKDAQSNAAATPDQGLPLSTTGVINSNVRALLQLGADRPADEGSAASIDGLDTPSTAAAGSSWQGTLERMLSGAMGVAGSAAKMLPGGDPVSFVRALAPQAAVAAKKLGVSVRALLAQAALETGWGKHLPSHGDGSSSNNLFGIKAGSSWEGGRVNVPTVEFEDGVAVRRQAQFRAYASPADSFANYAQLLHDNPRYSGALGKGDDVLGFARGLVNGGYATDPDYAAKVAALANSPAMRQALAALKNVVNLPTSHE
ncbi:MAG: flagellar assembly peptidoglycan hydrolase FlgJ [Rhodanobacter sp.]